MASKSIRRFMKFIIKSGMCALWEAFKFTRILGIRRFLSGNSLEKEREIVCLKREKLFECEWDREKMRERKC